MLAAGIMKTAHVYIALATALLSSGCASSPAVAAHPTAATFAPCPVLTPAERTAGLLREPGVVGPLTAGGLHIATGGGAMMMDDSGTATAVGGISLGIGVAALAAAGIVALADEGPGCASGDRHAAVDHHDLPGHE